MAIRQVAKMGHPILRRVAAPVEDPTDPEVARLAADMQDTLEDLGASGIAAPQVFVSQRIVVYRMIESRIPAGSGIKPVPWTVMINPVLTPLDDETVPMWERCLSIPGLHGKVNRYARIGVEYLTLAGNTVRDEAHGTWAALLQHECDHLDGVLYPMRMSDMSLLAFNDSPGPLADDVAARPGEIDPLFIDLVARWPTRDRWTA